MQNLGFLKALALSGGEWVLYFLLFCSVLSVAVMLERVVYLLRHRGDDNRLQDQVIAALSTGNRENAVDFARLGKSSIARILFAGLSNEIASIQMRERSMESQIITERIALERYLVILGTLGNNAPFIGLFGTVLGIIKAFNDLGLNGGGGPKVVMTGISEALIATAVGLMVAIPAVIAYNLFLRTVKKMVGRMENAGRLLLSCIESIEGAKEVRHGR